MSCSIAGAGMVAESGRPIAHVARDLGIHHETLRKWVRQAEADAGKRSELLSSQKREELKALRGEGEKAEADFRISLARRGSRTAELDPRRTK